MKDNKRKKLVDRGAEALADALISLASQDKLAADVVERLRSDQQELIKKSNGRLAD